MQRSAARRGFKGSGVAKRYCITNSVGDTFMQCWSAMRAFRPRTRPPLRKPWYSRSIPPPSRGYWPEIQRRFQTASPVPNSV